MAARFPFCVTLAHFLNVIELPYERSPANQRARKRSGRGEFEERARVRNTGFQHTYSGRLYQSTATPMGIRYSTSVVTATVLAAGLVAAASVVPRATAQTPRHVYVAELSGNRVSRINLETGIIVDRFVTAESGGLRGATGLAFGPGDDLFVSSSQTHQILRYDGSDGTFLDTYTEPGVVSSPFSLIFGSGGHAWVSSGSDHTVTKLDLAGRPVGPGLRHDSLRVPIGLAFGADSLLYVANAAGGSVMRFDPADGSFVDAFTTDSLSFPSDLAFDGNGGLYVSSAFSGSVYKFDATTGAPAGKVAMLPDDGIPVGLAYAPEVGLIIGDFRHGRLFLLDPIDDSLRLLTPEGLMQPENLVVR